MSLPVRESKQLNLAWEYFELLILIWDWDSRFPLRNIESICDSPLSCDWKQCWKYVKLGILLWGIFYLYLNNLFYPTGTYNDLVFSKIANNSQQGAVFKFTFYLHPVSQIQDA